MSATTERMTDTTQAGIRLKKAAIYCQGEASRLLEHLDVGSNVEGLLRAADAYALAFEALGKELEDDDVQELTEPVR